MFVWFPETNSSDDQSLYTTYTLANWISSFGDTFLNHPLSLKIGKVHKANTVFRNALNSNVVKNNIKTFTVKRFIRRFEGNLPFFFKYNLCRLLFPLFLRFRPNPLFYSCFLNRLYDQPHYVLIDLIISPL